ncbi:hypothetical protein C9446_20730 (plasmid) [Providencia heimbachae]|nr:hypothetical protein C9446_20730 [Providencia heimbachae]
MVKMQEIKPGQIWEEVDPRYTPLRQIEVLEVVSVTGPKGIRIRSPSGRVVWASAERFSGKRGGYRLAADQPASELQ